MRTLLDDGHNVVWFDNFLTGWPENVEHLLGRRGFRLIDVNIGNPYELSILKTGMLVRELCRSDAPISFVPRPQDDPSVRQPDITLAREELGREPKVDVHAGLVRTIEWFVDQRGRDQRVA